jgi:hypothetical protein
VYHSDKRAKLFLAFEHSRTINTNKTHLVRVSKKKKDAWRRHEN